jgi:uncharacterized protein
MISDSIFIQFLEQETSGNPDSAHDLAHIKRVVNSAMKLCDEEGADSEVVHAAAWLHDCVSLPKNHPDRKKSSVLAAQKAAHFLSKTDFPESKISLVVHAIEAHSFSAGITPESTEAKIVQDADRMDALGAIGIARCLLVGGVLGRPLYNPEDPFCENREPDDTLWTIDHFYVKLFRLPETMHTESAKKEALKRVKVMKAWLNDLKSEIENQTLSRL